MLHVGPLSCLDVLWWFFFLWWFCSVLSLLIASDAPFGWVVQFWMFYMHKNAFFYGLSWSTFPDKLCVHCISPSERACPAVQRNVFFRAARLKTTIQPKEDHVSTTRKRSWQPFRLVRHSPILVLRKMSLGWKARLYRSRALPHAFMTARLLISNLSSN